MIELLIVIVLVGLMTTISITSIRSLLNNTVSDSEQQTMLSILKQARNHALTANVTVVVCPIDINGNCIAAWEETWIVFIDNNANKNISASERVLLTYQPKGQNILLRFSGFGASSRYIQFIPQGRMKANNGTLVYCQAGDLSYARVIIINRQGRARVGVDANQNGIVENAKNIDIACGYD